MKLYTGKTEILCSETIIRLFGEPQEHKWEFLDPTSDACYGYPLWRDVTKPEVGPEEEA